MAATVWVKPLSGGWEPIGSSEDRGVWHEDLTCVSDQWGPKETTWSLKRQRRGVFPDLLARTPVVVEEGGVRVWRGRIKEAPEQNGRDRQITVRALGAQYKLDDDKLERILVHTKLADWKDQRSFLAADLSKFRASGQVTADRGVLILSFPKGADLNGDTRVGVTLDLGPSSTAKRVVCDSFSFLAADGSASFKCRGTDTPDGSTGGEVLWTFSGASSPVAQAATFTTARRYLHLTFEHSFTGTATVDTGLRVGSVKAFADTAHESGSASILSAKMIIVDALTRAVTGLHPDWTGIGDPTFAFPDFAPDQPRTARELVTAANAPHGWQFKINEQLQPIYRARPTVPVVDLGSWLGNEADTGSSNSDEGVVTKVIVRGQDAASIPIRSTRTQTGTIIDRQGDTVAVALDASYTLTQTFADKLGDTYLAAHRVSPFKGQNTVTAEGARRPAGGTIRPAHLLLLTGELARRTDLIDPDTGALGRTAVIDQVTYRDDDGVSELDLDNTRRDFEALQERLGLLVPA